MYTSHIWVHSLLNVDVLDLKKQNSIFTGDGQTGPAFLPYQSYLEITRQDDRDYFQKDCMKEK